MIAINLLLLPTICSSLLFGSMASTKSGSSTATTPAIKGDASTTEIKVAAKESKLATSAEPIVIVLFGPAGSGKTWLSNTLKTNIENMEQKGAGALLNANPWQIVALDEIPKKELKLYKDTKSLTRENLAVIARIQKGQATHNIICDTVLPDAREAKAFSDALSNIKKLYHVLVYCNLAELAQRSAERKIKAKTDKAYDRDPLSPFTQYRNLFSPVQTERSISTTELDQKADAATATTATAKARARSNSMAITRETSSTEHKISASPQSSPDSINTPPPLDIISESDIKKACAVAIPSVRATKSTTKPLTDKEKKAAEMNERARDYMVGSFMSGFSAFTVYKEAAIIPNPAIPHDLAVKNTTEAEGKLAVEQIIDFVINAQTATQTQGKQ